MFQSLNKLFSGKSPKKDGPIMPESPSGGSPSRFQAPDRKPTFSKVFRWRLPAGQTAHPATVEVVGSFTQWQKVPLQRDNAMDAWHVTLHHIQGHRTHRYMMLIDGQPVPDKSCDGMAPPHGPDEEPFAYQTEKGPRVCMLFSQTK